MKEEKPNLFLGPLMAVVICVMGVLVWLDKKFRTKESVSDEKDFE